MTDKQYAERDAMALDQVGGHYFRHVMAMTAEKLHSKGDIAAELGYRDMQIAALQEQVQKLAAEGVQLKAIVDGVNSELYGQGFEVAGWHLNGELEPLDNWFTDNGWGVPETPITDAVIREIGAKAVEGFGSWLSRDKCGDGESQMELGEVLDALEEHSAKLRAGEHP